LALFPDAEPAELLREAGALGAEATQLIELAGLDWSQCGALGRHLTFLVRFLKKNDKASCASDVRDIVSFDLPTTLSAIISASSSAELLDQKLKAAVVPLIDGGHFDSAIRKAFVVLTERLREAFGAPKEMDGEDLVNAAFGKSTKVPLRLEESQRQAFRNLFSGFYGVYRNRYAHNDTTAQLSDAQTIAHMVNQLLVEIEGIVVNAAKEP
jgi:hypothetical protein